MFPLLCLGSCVNICQIQFQSMDLSTKLHETSLVFCPTLSDPNFVQLPQWKSSCKLQNTLQWFFFAGPHLWIPPLFTNKNTFVSAKATQLQHIRGLVWSSAYRILRNINSMASDLMVLPRCYTTLMATCSARNGGWTGHGFWSDPWTHCTQQLQHWMACKDETIWRETTTVQDLWWMAVIFCFITSFIKAFHLSPVFFFSEVSAKATPVAIMNISDLMRILTAISISCWPTILSTQWFLWCILVSFCLWWARNGASRNGGRGWN